MKFEVTNPKAWKAVNEKKIPMKHKIKVYEKLGGAYRLGEDGGEQVFNKMTELLKHRMQEGDDNSSPEETLAGLKDMAMGNLERIADYANMIETRMKDGQELDSWMYSQLTVALENLNSVHDAMDGDDGEREPMKENVEVRDGKYRFYSKDGMGYLTYGGKEISSGDFDWDDGSNSYWMSHSSFKGQKGFDTGKDIVKYFKSKRITQP
jgi:hypothetical protein